MKKKFIQAEQCTAEQCKTEQSTSGQCPEEPFDCRTVHGLTAHVDGTILHAKCTVIVHCYFVHQYAEEV